MKKEKGITLLALAITIIVLIILTAVTINGLTGEEGILTSTTSATKSYTIAEYKEKLEESVQQTIIAKAVLGEEATLDSLKENIASIDTSMQTITMGDSISDVIVKTEEGYLFQVYFDELLGEYHVEYMGNADTSYVPQITYTENAGLITINATSGNISKITISLNGKELNSTDTNQLTYTATTSGTYVVTIETTEGLTRYAYINVTLSNSILSQPTINVKAGTEGNNGWYTTPVNVELDGSATNGTTMKYKLVGVTTKEETEITNLSDTTVITIENAGLTKVIAWVEYTENGTTYKSDYSYYNVKIDNVAPDAPTASVSATEGNEVSNVNTYWYTTGVEVEITAEDTHSGIYGYSYSITGSTNVSETTVIGKTQNITFETDGNYTLIIYSIDKAGNKSETSFALTVYKDSTAPNDFVPSISNVTNTSFTISAYTMDDTSGILKYEYYVNNELKYTGTENTYDVSGLSKNNTYGVYVIAYDNAGNARASSSISVYTTTTTTGSTGSGTSVSDGATIGYGTYTLTYDSNGIEVSNLPDSRTFIYGETVTLPSDSLEPTSNNAIFIGWSTDPSAEETIYYQGRTITGYGNITLYAIWGTSSTIKFNSNGGDVTPDTQSFDSGEYITLPTNAGTYANDITAELLGWAYTADNTFVYYKPGDIYNDSSHGNCTLYAVWDLGVTITLDTNGGSYENTYLDKVPLMFTFASGTSVTLPTDAGTYTENVRATHFKWVLGSKTGTEYYEGGDSFSNSATDGQTLYAMWDNVIDFDSNGGTINPETQFLAYGESITLPSTAGTYTSDTSRSLTGWTDDQKPWGSIKIHDPSGTYSNYSSGALTTMYAVWGMFYASELKQGDVVAYTTLAGTFNATTDYTGYSYTQTYTTEEETTNWVVMSTTDQATYPELVQVDNEKTLIIYGSKGYNGLQTVLNGISNLYITDYAISSYSLGFDYENTTGLQSTHTNCMYTLYNTYGYSCIYGGTLMTGSGTAVNTSRTN